MAEHFLDGADVGAVDQKFGRVTVAESVRGDAFYDAGFECVFSDYFFDGDRGEAAFFGIEDVGRLPFSAVYEKWIEVVVTRFHV